jgi:hypothetical protein
VRIDKPQEQQMMEQEAWQQGANLPREPVEKQAACLSIQRNCISKTFIPIIVFPGESGDPSLGGTDLVTIGANRRCRAVDTGFRQAFAGKGAKSHH